MYSSFLDFLRMILLYKRTWMTRLRIRTDSFAILSVTLSTTLLCLRLLFGWHSHHCKCRGKTQAKHGKTEFCHSGCCWIWSSPKWLPNTQVSMIEYVSVWSRQCIWPDGVHQHKPLACQLLHTAPEDFLWVVWSAYCSSTCACNGIKFRHWKRRIFRQQFLLRLPLGLS